MRRGEKKKHKTAAFVRFITRQQLHFCRWSQWVRAFYSDPYVFISPLRGNTFLALQFLGF